MNFKALVVDDDDGIREAVADILGSLGHTFSEAATQEEAREYLKSGKEFAYVLLDLQIPLKRGSTARIQNGINLLCEIRSMPEMKFTPVIVMTSYGKDSPELAVQVMKCGAVDFVTKPFPASGETLDKRIREALHVPEFATPTEPEMGLHSSEKSLVPFNSQKRKLVIYPSKITVCGVRLWSEKLTSDMRDALKVLSRKEDDVYIRLSGPALHKKIGRDVSNPIARPIKEFCDRGTDELAVHRGLACDRYDIIASKGGYHFQNWIEVEIADDDDVRAANGPHGSDRESREPDKKGDGPHEPQARAIDKLLADLPPDQRARLLKAHVVLTAKSLTREEIRRLSRVSRTQNTRDLSELEKRGLLSRIGTKLERKYRAATPP